MTKYKYLYFLLFCMFLNTVHGQVGFGTATISDGVVLQLESATKGTLFPRVALSSRIATTPLPASIPTGTSIFNTATAGIFPNIITPGLYWWSAEELQWTSFSTNLKNAVAKYTNSEAEGNYNVTNYLSVPLFGSKIINESTAIYSKTSNTDLTVRISGLYSISTLLSFDRDDGGDGSRISITAKVFINGVEAGTEQVVNAGYTASIGDQRGKFTFPFTEYLQLAANDVVSIRVKKTAGIYGNGDGDSNVFLTAAGESSISINKIR